MCCMLRHMLFARPRYAVLGLGTKCSFKGRTVRREEVLNVVYCTLLALFGPRVVGRRVVPNAEIILA